jgi:hypothetical protein
MHRVHSDLHEEKRPLLEAAAKQRSKDRDREHYSVCNSNL